MEKKISSWLKTLKLNEDKISMVLGVMVVFLVAGMVFRYFNQVGKQNKPEVTATNTRELTPMMNNDTYVVGLGDDLGKIALLKYGNRELWQKIADANQIDNPDLIEVGMTLVIPRIGEDVVAVETVDQTHKVDLEEQVYGSIMEKKYIVKVGDQLWDIAVRAYGDGFRWEEIARVNKLSNPDDLEAGLVLVLPR